MQNIHAKKVDVKKMIDIIQMGITEVKSKCEEKTTWAAKLETCSQVTISMMWA